MAIGRTFQESFQKALRALEIGADGFDEVAVGDGDSDHSDRDRGGDGDRDREHESDGDGDGDGNGNSDGDNHSETLAAQLRVPGAMRPWHLAEAFRRGMTIEQAHAICKIDRWFLAEVADLIAAEKHIASFAGKLKELPAKTMRAWKQKGFSDRRIARLMNSDEESVRAFRCAARIHPVFKRVDSCAAEFDAVTAYMYSSYDDECEAAPTARKKIMILGGGPNRIGQGIEFDYCCVHASMALREAGVETIMVNCNPETVSTDYDTSDRLYFEPLTLEDVLEVARVEKPDGVIVQYGGQTPLKLARALAKCGVPVIGTSPESIHRAEDRKYFRQLLTELGLRQPENATTTDFNDALDIAARIGYPLMARPSYVLGGRAMEIVHNDDELRNYMRAAPHAGANDSPILLDRFLADAMEVDVDAVCDGAEVLIGGIMQHIEAAGVHSGDSACSLPPFSLPQELQHELRRQTRELALALKVVGLMNVQFAVKDGDIYVLEVNPRASRTVPFVSKATARPLAKIAARCMNGASLSSQNLQPSHNLNGEHAPAFYSVKEAVFPFIKFPGVDPVLGPEMKSTGEVMGIGGSFGEAFGKAQRAVGLDIPRGGRALMSLKTEDHFAGRGIARELAAAGFALAATEGTAASLRADGLEVARVNKVSEGRPHVIDKIKNGEFDLVINTTAGKRSRADSHTIRREALLHKVTYFTTLAGARAAVEAHQAQASGDDRARNLQTLHKLIGDNTNLPGKTTKTQ